MNERQRRFVEEYLVDGNATQAAIRAGYSERAANREGSRLLSKVDVKAAIESRRRERSVQADVTAVDVIRELARVAFSNIGLFLDCSGGVPRLRQLATIPEDVWRAVSSVKVRREWEGPRDDQTPVDVVEFKLWSKTDALDKLAKILGMYVERKEVTGKDGGPLQHDLNHATPDLSEYADAFRDLARGLLGPVDGDVRPDGRGQPADPPPPDPAAGPVSDGHGH